MRIGIDFHSAEREGSGNCTYIRNLVESFVRIAPEHEYFLYVVNPVHPYYRFFKPYANVHLRPLGTANPVIRIPLLGIKTFVDGIDVLHVQYIAPPVHKGKLVAMIHDLAFLHFPQCFSRFEAWRSCRLIPRNARKASCVLTVSEYSKSDIASRLRLDPAKIEVTYDAVGSSFRPCGGPRSTETFLKTYRIPGNYILSVGRLDPRKNLLRLITAFVRLKREHNIPQKLVLVGKKDYLSDEIEKATAGWEREIIRTGYVPEEDLVKLYCGADLFVYPTLFEGFGLPCLESMACGCPLISSRTSSIPEVVGDAGLLIDPYSVDEMAAAIMKVLSSSQLRDKLRTRGLEQARKFSWEASARKTLEVFQRYA